MFPAPQQCPNCPVLHQQISDQAIMIGRLNQEAANREELIRNMHANAKVMQQQTDDMTKAARIAEKLASEKWKEVAVALDMELPERQTGLEYQGPIIYTAEYIVSGITKLRAQVTFWKEIANNLKGRLQLQQGAFEGHVKALANRMVDGMLQIEAPKENAHAEEDAHAETPSQ